jgi:probable F420-dependent oxidoreductase
MKWGIVFSSTGFPDPAGAVALAETAEAVGFESLWAPEHIVIPVSYETKYRASESGRIDRLSSRGGIPDPIVWFAFVASRTTTLRFGTGVMIVPEHNPVVLAKSIATLAHLSNGRFMLGAGVGEFREEYDAVGTEFTNRGRRMDEALQILQSLWSEDAAEFHGEHYDFAPVQCEPKPPGGKVPLHIGGVSDAAIRRTARFGDGYFPFVDPTQDLHETLNTALRKVREATAQEGRDPDALEFTAGGARTVEAAKWFADQGIHRLTIAVRSRTIPDMQEELRRFAGEVIEPTRDL